MPRTTRSHLLMNAVYPWGLTSCERRPRFWVWASQDPNGPPLDRIQIVKGWVENGEAAPECQGCGLFERAAAGYFG